MTMAYASVGIGAANLIGGIVSSKSSKKLQKEALALQREQLAFAKQRYTDNQELYGGVKKQAVADAMTGVKADLGGVTSRATGDVASAFANADAERIRNQQRLGIAPDSGRADAMANSNAIQKALAMAGNVTTQRETERKRADDLTRSGRQWAANLGVAELNNSASGVASAAQNMASTYGNAADQQAQAAGQFFHGAGSALGTAAANWRPTGSAVPMPAMTTPYQSPAQKSAIANSNLITDLTATPQASQYVLKGAQNRAAPGWNFPAAVGF